MLIVMDKNAGEEQVQQMISHLKDLNLKPEILPGAQRLAIGVTGNKQFIDHEEIERMPGVVEVIHVSHKYKKVSRDFIPDNTKVPVNDICFGDRQPVVIAGPCSIESEKQVMETAAFLKSRGVKVLRGGIFKPRTSPYFFQGIGYVGLQYLKKARQETGMSLCVEIMSTDDIELFNHEVDIIQVGARNMQNFDLLKKLSRLHKPILLKRSPAATVEEFLLAAEYLVEDGNYNIILCERGIRTFESSTRNTLDLNSVALIKKLSHLPIIADPSHAAGRHDLVIPLSKAALAVGADGLIVEVHPEPMKALSDQNQQLDFEEFEKLMEEIQLFSHRHSPAVSVEVGAK